MQAIHPASVGLRQVLFESPAIDRQIIHLVQPETLSDEDILTGEAYSLYAKDLSTFLLEEVTESLPEGTTTLSPMKLEHFHAESHFDCAVCWLLQREEDIPCFDIQTSFFCGTTLVTTAKQSAFLDF